MIYVLFLNPFQLPLLLTLGSVHEQNLSADTRYQRVGQGAIAEVIDLGERDGCERTAVVDALVSLEELGDCGVVDAEYFFDFDE
jgi:hypothetical protein